MKIEVSGYNLDNLIKTLHRRKISLYKLERPTYNKLIFEIKDSDYKKIRRHIANFKVKETLSKFKQLPHIILNNLGVIIGCFIGLIFGVYASKYTWQIRIYGTKDLSQNEILKVLEENGIRKGKINHQTSGEIEEILLNRYDRIAQVSAIKKGTAIIINISEKLVYKEIEFQPITAKYSGIIKEINVITGTVNIKVGDYVNVGDILVLPFNLNANGEKVSVFPIAEIKGEMYVVSKSEIKRNEIILVRSGNATTTYQYKFRNTKIFSGKNKNSFALFETTMYNENISDILPLNRDVITYYELVEREVLRDFEKEKQGLIDKSIALAYQNLPIGKILSENTQTSIVDDSMFAITTITIYGIIT